MTKRVIKIALISIMAIFFTLTIANIISTENQANTNNNTTNKPTGTLVIHPDGSWDCQGAPLDC